MSKNTKSFCPAFAAAQGVGQGVALDPIDNIQFINGVAIFSFTTAITAGVTTTSLAAGNFALTSNATGLGTLFVSDGTYWQTAASNVSTGVTLAGSQVLTNKTLTDAILNGLILGVTTAITLAAADVTLSAGQIATGILAVTTGHATHSIIGPNTTGQVYLVLNNDPVNIVNVKVAGQTPLVIPPGKAGLVYCNGTNYALLGLFGKDTVANVTGASQTYAALDTDVLITCTTVSVTCAITLPQGAAYAGKKYVIAKDASAIGVSVAGATGSIYGWASPLATGAIHSVTLVSDGTNYWAEASV